jgi:peptidyl-prolyl cis-trans isomerase SurA
MSRRRHLAWLWVLALLLPGRAAAGEVVEKIVAVVEEEPILLSDIELRYQQLVAQGVVDTADTAQARSIRQQILDQLIDDRLILLEAEAQGIQVAGDEVEQAVEDAIQNLITQFGGREAFEEQLRREGLTEEELRQRYREDARKQLLANRLVGQEIRSKVEVTDADVRAFYEENRDQLPKKPKLLRVSDIFIRLRPDSMVEARRYAEALQIRQEILDGRVTFEEAARLYSDDPSSDNGGDLGRFQRGDLDPAFEAAAFRLQPGEISMPVRSRFGYHLIRLDEKAPDGSWARAHHILLALAPSKLDETRARMRAEQVRARLLSGESFEAVAREVSDDSLSARNGGDLGWLPMDAFQGAVKAVVDTLKLGQISEVIPGDGGFHILKITGQQEPGEYTFEEIREDLTEMVRRQRMEEAYREWMEKLRQKYYVEVHPLGDL